MCVSHNQNYPASYPFTVKFDNGEWIPAKTNFVCSGSIVGDPAKIIIESVGEGLVMAPGDGIEWLLDMPVIGTGGLVKRGDGTLALVQSAMLYSGVTKVEEGVLSLNDATLSDAVLAGGGTVDNGVLYEATLKVNVSDEYEVDQTLMLGNSLSVSGSLLIDLGRTHENPLPLPFARFPVARYDGGGTPPVSGECRIMNGGYKSMRGKIECEQGVVYVTPRLVGFSIIIR
jgi:autotransporter-associated beta strand protein